jgi:hypothetical protein
MSPASGLPPLWDGSLSLPKRYPLSAFQASLWVNMFHTTRYTENVVLWKLQRARVAGMLLRERRSTCRCVTERVAAIRQSSSVEKRDTCCGTDCVWRGRVGAKSLPWSGHETALVQKPQTPRCSRNCTQSSPERPPDVPESARLR